MTTSSAKSVTPGGSVAGGAASSDSLQREGILLLSKAEVQSGSTRQKWAEGLILQLPNNHDGRNAWLINYGTGEEAEAKRFAWNARAIKDGREPSCVFNEVTRSTGTPAIAKATAGETRNAEPIHRRDGDEG